MPKQTSIVEPSSEPPIIINRGAHVAETISFIAAKRLFDRMKEQGCDVRLETQDKRDSPTYKVRMNRKHNLEYVIDTKLFKAEAQTDALWTKKLEDIYRTNYISPYIFDMHTSNEKIFAPTSVDPLDWKAEYMVGFGMFHCLKPSPKGQIVSFKGWESPVADKHFTIEMPGPVKLDKNGDELTYWNPKDIKKYRRIARNYPLYDNKLAWTKGYFSTEVIDKIIRLIHAIIETEGKEDILIG